MRVNIWIHKSDAISGTVTDYKLTRPYHDRNDEWVQVSISTDDFAQLEDFSKPEENLFKDEEKLARDSHNWLIEQYNRNREKSDHIEDIDDITGVGEQDNQPFGD